MQKTVGVRCWIDALRSPSIKREALLFDQVGITDLDVLLERKNPILKPDILDLEWLCEQGIVFNLGPTKPIKQPKGNEEFDRCYDLARKELINFQTALVERLLSYEEIGNQRVKKTNSTIERQDNRVRSVGSMVSDYYARCAAIQLRDVHLDGWHTKIQGYAIGE